MQNNHNKFQNVKKINILPRKPEVDVRVLCPTCKKTFLSSEIRQHCLKHHGNVYMSPPKISMSPKTSPNASPKIIVNCPKCNIRINQKSLSKHVKNCNWTPDIQKYVKQNMQHIVPAANRISNATRTSTERDRNVQNAPKPIKPPGNENKFPCMYKSCERKGKEIHDLKKYFLIKLNTIGYTIILYGYFSRFSINLVEL